MAHRQQDVAGLCDAGRARRAGRTLDATRVEEHEQRIALAARKREMGVARQPGLEVGTRVPVEHRLWHRLDDPANEVITKPGELVGVLGLALDGELRGYSQRRDCGRGPRAGTNVALLPTTMKDRDGSQFVAEQQHTDADWSTDLVTGHRHRVQADGREVHWELPDCLDGIGMNRHRVRPCDLGELRDRLYGADLVVCPHHRDERGRAWIPFECLRESLRVYPAEPIHGQQLDLGALVLPEPLRRIQNRMVFDRSDDHPPPPIILRTTRPVEALDREIVRFGSASGEDHLRRPSPERLRYRFPGLLDDSASGAARAMQ